MLQKYISSPLTLPQQTRKHKFQKYIRIIIIIINETNKKGCGLVWTTYNSKAAMHPEKYLYFKNIYNCDGGILPERCVGKSNSSNTFLNTTNKTFSYETFAKRGNECCNMKENVTEIF